MIVDDYEAIAVEVTRLGSICPLSNYPSNPALLTQIACSKNLGKINDELAAMLTQIVDRYFSKRLQFHECSVQDKIRTNALHMLWRVALQFDSSLSQNPFAYYVKMIVNSAERTIALQHVA